MTRDRQVGAEVQLIRDLLDRRQAAIRAKDISASLAPYADDVVIFDLAPPLQCLGPDEKGVTEWYSTWQESIGFDIRDRHIAAADDVAYSHSLVHLTGHRTDGRETDLWFRETVCLRKINGEWKITHEHGSVPLRMDVKDMAATDLKP
jgi:ketosteroid isomerase-like protein